MKKVIIILSLLILVFIGVTAFQQKDNSAENWGENTTVTEVLLDLGDTRQNHYIKPTAEDIKKGEEIVKVGYTRDSKGRKTTKVSKHYVCTSCHNLEREDPILSISNAETRLPYVKDRNIPFLQGTTFWGITNRESWYNDDYIRKYGDEKISKANKDLRESIQLCAIECSQGRYMEDWEIENVLAYYTSLELKMSDLGLTKSDWEKLKKEGTNSFKKEATIAWLKGKYATKSPATFYDSPKDKKDGYEGMKPGNPAIGKDIYDLSCKFCHQPKNKDLGVSHYVLDDSKMSFQHLKNKMFKNSHMSIYQIIPYGTYAIPGHRPYMPHYPEERMTKQQVEDLRAYVLQEAM
ncbi:MAG: mono/diheme cytochrome c family protein [Cognaticolwellia sp.]|jgi:mono/diheme cytochrome c family protein|tara:strand:- start:2001 stop:3047 length:1047 start_codon:yes stop_codon:yes gene_type:complete